MTSYAFLDPPTQPGDLGQLGHYRVIDELGKGGMGYVFRAEDTKLQRSVALKVMNQKIAGTPHSRRRFIHEARAMAAVHHDNVATIFEVGESKGTPFMAMEMLRGCTLETLNDRDRRLEFPEIIEFARQMARGLAAAHAQGIVHRDIKPANIWIQEGSERVKILDFGLALASSPVDHLAGRGAVIGTPGYLSPEQARSEPLDDRSDLYSLGVVLYELCTGQLPIKSSSVPSQLISILAHRPTPVGELNPEIPKPLCDLIHRLLRKEPRTRPSSADVLLEQLELVEEECHAKSEVAQAINKLQLGLSEVVNKNSDSEIFEFDSVPEAITDPLAAAPIAQPVTTPASAPSARPTPASAPSARPTLSAARPGHPAGSNRATAATHAEAPAWQAYWPLAAIVAVVLLALPLLTYAFTGTGRGKSAYLITDEGGSATAPAVDPSIGVAAPASAPEGRMTENGSRRTAPNGQRNNGRNDDRGANADPNQNQDRPGDSQDRRQRNGTGPGVEMAAASTSASRNDLEASTKLASAESGARDRVEELPSSDTSTGADLSTSTPSREMKWTTISTADGEGADARVQKGSNQRYGRKLSLGVQRRGNIENNHSYLRFDLSDINETRPWTESAELVLTVVGEKRPVGADLRVYSADAGLWKEEDIQWSNSYSSRGLDSLPLLADVIVDREVDPRDTGLNVIRISTPELAKAIADASEDSLTLIVAGAAPARNAAMLRFVSREQSETNAPRLVAQTPTQPPSETKTRQGRRRGARQ